MTLSIAAYFMIALNLSWAADSQAIYTQTKLKNAVLRFENNSEALKNALRRSQIKKIFIILLDVPADKLSLFVDERLLEEAIGRVRLELVLPLQKQRFEIICQLLRSAKDHPMISKAFASSKEAARALLREEEDAGFHYAIGRGFERLAVSTAQEIFDLVRTLLDTQEVLLDPMKIFRMAAKRGLKILAPQNISEWHHVLFEIEPNLFLASEDPNQDFFYSYKTRRLFSNPHYLYQYLIQKNRMVLPNLAREFLETYEKEVPVTERSDYLSPRQWAAIYGELSRSYPQILAGVFSFSENKIFFEFYHALAQLNQNHVFYCSDLIRHALKENPRELMAALRFILRKERKFSSSEIQNVTPQQFIDWLMEGRIPSLQYAIKKLKTSRQTLQYLEQHLLKSDKPLDAETLLWAEQTVGKSLGHLDTLWYNLGLPLKETDDLHLREGSCAENLKHIAIAKNFIGKFFGEDYMIALHALKIHIRKVQIK